MYAIKDFLIALHSLEVVEQEEIKKFQKQYPVTFQYVVFIPFFNSKKRSREVYIAAEVLRRKIATMKRIVEVFDNCDAIDYIEETIAFWAEENPKFYNWRDCDIEKQIKITQ